MTETLSVHYALQLHLQMPLNLNMYTSYYTVHIEHCTLHTTCVHCIFQMYHFTLKNPKCACVGLNIYMAKCTLIYGGGTKTLTVPGYFLAYFAPFFYS